MEERESTRIGKVVEERESRSSTCSRVRSGWDVPVAHYHTFVVFQSCRESRMPPVLFGTSRYIRPAALGGGRGGTPMPDLGRHF